MGSCECGLEGFRAVEIRGDDFVGKPAMLVGMAGEGAHLESALRLQGADYRASLLPRGADDGDEFLAVWMTFVASWWWSSHAALGAKAPANAIDFRFALIERLRLVWTE